MLAQIDVNANMITQMWARGLCTPKHLLSSWAGVLPTSIDHCRYASRCLTVALLDQSLLAVAATCNEQCQFATTLPFQPVVFHSLAHLCRFAPLDDLGEAMRGRRVVGVADGALGIGRTTCDATALTADEARERQRQRCSFTYIVLTGTQARCDAQTDGIRRGWMLRINSSLWSRSFVASW